jgi:hypothetical protein
VESIVVTSDDEDEFETRTRELRRSQVSLSLGVEARCGVARLMLGDDVDAVFEDGTTGRAT